MRNAAGVDAAAMPAATTDEAVASRAATIIATGDKQFQSQRAQFQSLRAAIAPAQDATDDEGVADAATTVPAITPERAPPTPPNVTPVPTATMPMHTATAVTTATWETMIADSARRCAEAEAHIADSARRRADAEAHTQQTLARCV